ncbi:MAG TPA: glycine oxidase ThiO [Gemmatimonadales bacterium]|nr:glycine oxidase ThiO [Gemmatimonadales bacterium]
MASVYDVIVVGGGAAGAASARELAASGRRVLVIEPGGYIGQAWRAAGGMLAPQIEADANDPLLDLGLAAREHYGPLARSLLENTGKDIGLWQEGIARVASDDGEAAELKTKVQWQRQQGHVCEWLEAEEVRRRWPWLGPTAGALWAGRDGALDPASLVQALLADAERLGAAVVADRAIRIERAGERVTGVTAERGRYSAGHVVVAAGAWSPLLEGLPRPLPIEPVRGQMAALPWPAAVPRAIVYHRDCYLLARGGEAIIGSTMESAGFRPEVTTAGLAQIFAATMLLYPNLIRGKVRRTWAGLRPMTPDGLPIIGGEPLLSGLWYATGHGRNGILLAGLTGVLIRQLIEEAQPVRDVRALSADRF